MESRNRNLMMDVFEIFYQKYLEKLSSISSVCIRFSGVIQLLFKPGKGI